MSLEMAHKVIVPQKKIMSRSFLNSGTLIFIIYCKSIFSILIIEEVKQEELDERDEREDCW
jgi:hypothetical protein